MSQVTFLPTAFLSQVIPKPPSPKFWRLSSLTTGKTQYLTDRLSAGDMGMGEKISLQPSLLSTADHWKENVLPNVPSSLRDHISSAK